MRPLPPSRIALIVFLFLLAVAAGLLGVWSWQDRPTTPGLLAFGIAAILAGTAIRLLSHHFERREEPEPSHEGDLDL
jgi:hypothetical protein